MAATNDEMGLLVSPVGGDCQRCPSLVAVHFTCRPRVRERFHLGNLQPKGTASDGDGLARRSGWGLEVGEAMQFAFQHTGLTSDREAGQSPGVDLALQLRRGATQNARCLVE